MWTMGPPDYSPEDAYGDAHPGPGVVHLTLNAFVGETNYELQRTLIHEAVHRMGTLDDDEADAWMTLCYRAA